MSAQYENVQKFGKEQIETSLKTFGVLSKGLQGIAAELASYSQKSFAEGASALEKLAEVKSFDKVVEIQTDYSKAAYEEFVANSAKINQLYADLAKEAFKPFEGAFERSQTAATEKG